MRRFPMLLVCTALAAPAASMAQAPDSGTGFFRPTPGNDPSLTHTLPPENPGNAPVPVAPPPALAAPVATAPAPAVPAAAIAAPAAERARTAETQMDRSEAEARQANEEAARGPQRINGAFTGLTDERDR